jgi:branched-chain amino acid transport system permease protein
VSYIAHLGVLVGLYSIVALSLNLLVGYAGRLTLAHAAFFGIGTYVYALLTVCLRWSLLPSLTCAALGAAMSSLVLAIPAVRFRSDTFVILTLAVQGAVFSLIYGWVSFESPLGTWRNLTNGALGISGVPVPSLFGYAFDSPAHFLVLILPAAIGSAATFRILLGSPWGRMIRAVRDDAVATAGLGKSLIAADTEAFLVASGFVGLAGGLFAAYMRFVDPSLASIDQSILLLSMVLIGGVSPWLGPVLGAGSLVLLPEMLRFARLSGPHAANIRLLFYGATLVVMMQTRGRGLAGRESVE